MAFEAESSNVPTSIGDLRITLFDTLTDATDQSFIALALDSPVSVLQGAGVEFVQGTVVLKTIDGLQTFVEDTDYTVAYANGNITLLSTGAAEAGIVYDLSFVTHGQSARFRLEILNQDGEKMADRSGDLGPHVTANERTALMGFMDTLRARATSEILG